MTGLLKFAIVFSSAVTFSSTPSDDIYNVSPNQDSITICNHIAVEKITVCNGVGVTFFIDGIERGDVIFIGERNNGSCQEFAVPIPYNSSHLEVTILQNSSTVSIKNFSIISNFPQDANGDESSSLRRYNDMTRSSKYPSTSHITVRNTMIQVHMDVCGGNIGDRNDFRCDDIMDHSQSQNDTCSRRYFCIDKTKVENLTNATFVVRAFSGTEPLPDLDQSYSLDTGDCTLLPATTITTITAANTDTAATAATTNSQEGTTAQYSWTTSTLLPVLIVTAQLVLL